MPDSVIATAVVIPTRAPFVSKRPPPDDPAAIDASVWIMPVSAASPPCVSTVRSSALMTPSVTDGPPSRPSGEPIAIAVWPTCSVAAWPRQRDRVAGASDLHHSDVAVGVGADEAAFVLRAVGEDDVDRGRVRYDVGVRDEVAVVAEEHA